MFLDVEITPFKTIKRTVLNVYSEASRNKLRVLQNTFIIKQLQVIHFTCFKILNLKNSRDTIQIL